MGDVTDHLRQQKLFMTVWKAMDTMLKIERLGGIEGLGVTDDMIANLVTTLSKRGWQLSCDATEHQWWYKDQPERSCDLPLGHEDGKRGVHHDERGVWKERWAVALLQARVL